MNVPTVAVDIDLLCIRCGYNLRTLAPAGRCPECGDLVALSVARRRQIGGAFLRRMWIGAFLIVLVAALHAVDIMQLPQMAAEALTLTGPANLVLHLAPMLTYMLLLPIAVRLLTSSRARQTPQRTLTGWLCTSAAIWGLLSVVLAQGLIVLPGRSDFLDTWAFWMLLALGGIFAWVVWYLNLAGLIFLRAFFRDRHWNTSALIAGIGLGLAALAPLAQIPWLAAITASMGSGWAIDFDDSGVATALRWVALIADILQLGVWMMAGIAALRLGRKR